MTSSPPVGLAALALFASVSCGASGAGVPCPTSVSCANGLECVAGVCVVRAPAGNARVRIMSGLSIPEQRELILRVGPNCVFPTFSVKADDPDVTDVIRALWFIDPDVRYVGGVQGNNGTAVSSEPTVRNVTAPGQFLANLSALADGKKHRVEVVVTDGDFVETVRTDAGVDSQPFLDTTRAAVVTAGQTLPVTAFRDDYAWLVQVDPTTPCQ